MSGAQVVGVALVVVVLLAGVFLAATGVRGDRAAAIGVLSRETRKRDRSAEGIEVVMPTSGSPATGREVERAAAVLARTRERTVAVPNVGAPPALNGPVDAETYGQTRRQFLNRGIVGVFAVGLSGFGAACLAFLWPPPSNGGFGGKVAAGTLADIQVALGKKQPFYSAQGRFYINPFPADPGAL